MPTFFNIYILLFLRKEEEIRNNKAKILKSNSWGNAGTNKQTT